MLKFVYTDEGFALGSAMPRFQGCLLHREG
jgi:hypothetical protein